MVMPCCVAHLPTGLLTPPRALVYRLHGAKGLATQASAIVKDTVPSYASLFSSGIEDRMEYCGPNFPNITAA